MSYIEAGAAMGWTPDEVCACSVSEFQAAFKGASKANGWQSPEEKFVLKDELRELMRHYPDGERRT